MPWKALAHSWCKWFTLWAHICSKLTAIGMFVKHMSIRAFLTTRWSCKAKCLNNALLSEWKHVTIHSWFKEHDIFIEWGCCWIILLVLLENILVKWGEELFVKDMRKEEKRILEVVTRDRLINRVKADDVFIVSVLLRDNIPVCNKLILETISICIYGFEKSLSFRRCIIVIEVIFLTFWNQWISISISLIAILFNRLASIQTPFNQWLQSPVKIVACTVWIAVRVLWFLFDNFICIEVRHSFTTYWTR